MKLAQTIEWFRQVAVSRFWNATHDQGGIATWAAEPRVRRSINRRITGSPDVWPVEWFAREVVKHPFPTALSLGCGEGALERDLLSKQLCIDLLGLDISERALELAREAANAGGFSGLRYARADLDRLQLEPESFDAIFVHQALHHVRELEECLRQVRRALTPDGIFYLDEYVGPSRDDWRHELLEAAEDAYQQLPRSVRRRKRLQLPVDWRDPSEAVRSAEIVPLLSELFEIREKRDYGGNLLAVVYPHLNLEGLEPAAREEILDRLLAQEEGLLLAGEPSYYSVLVAG